MHWFDVHIIVFLNQFVNRWPWFDFLVTRAYTINLIGCGVTVALAWCALFDRKTGDQFSKNHEILLAAFIFSGMAAVAARALALSLPFRTRPVWTPALEFQVPHGTQPSLLGWSSFPSDHAALFYALAVGILFVSRPLGLLAIGWVAATITFPAMYLGIHYPTDIIVGGCVGVGFAFCAKIRLVRETVLRYSVAWRNQQAGSFFAILFLWSYEIVNLFDDGRTLLRGIWHLI